MPRGIPRNGINKGWIKKGQKIPLEIRLRMNKDKLGKKRPPFSKEWKDKLSKAHKGKTLTRETRLKMSGAQIKRYDRIGRKQYKRSVHVRDKKYLIWRGLVFIRDNWTCQTCQIRGTYLEAHHIKGWSKFPELRYHVSNGVTLCRECHKLTDNYKNKQNAHTKHKR
jgi:hypothetical protein